MARSDELLILANRIDAYADDVGHGIDRETIMQGLWMVAKDIRDYVREN